MKCAGCVPPELYSSTFPNKKDLSTHYDRVHLSQGRKGLRSFPRYHPNSETTDIISLCRLINFTSLCFCNEYHLLDRSYFERFRTILRGDVGFGCITGLQHHQLSENTISNPFTSSTLYSIPFSRFHLYWLT